MFVVASIFVRLQRSTSQHITSTVDLLLCAISSRPFIGIFGNVRCQFKTTDLSGMDCAAFQHNLIFVVIIISVIFADDYVQSGQYERVLSSKPLSRPARGARGAEFGARTGDATGVPCLYEGHLKTDKNWFGYLANISVKMTGQMTFEFAYPADRCCQNVLFYLEEQMSIISPRMNCWQKEYLLRPEEDQILRLTPSFSWSGCHVTNHNEIDMFVCKGGRSFSVDSVNDRLTTWYIAVSNCATLQGLDLLYHLEVYGHVGECSRYQLGASSGDSTTPKLINNPVSKASLTPREAANTRQKEDPKVCIYRGNINTTNTWYGFLRNISLNSGGGFRFMFTYPYAMQTQNVILYTEDDIVKLDWEMTCWDKEGIISSENVPTQILDMSFRSTWTGCVANSSGDHHNMTCTGQRRYDSPQKIFMALSNCRSDKGLLLNYRLEVFGNQESVCAGATSIRLTAGFRSWGSQRRSYERQSLLEVAYNWTCVFGLALIAAMVSAELDMFSPLTFGQTFPNILR